MNKDIETSVHNLICRYHTRDPLKVLQYMKANVFYKDCYGLLKGFSAICMRSYYVMISSKLTNEEQRVVAAHELGHIILHKETLSKHYFREYDLYNNISLEEREANAFAAELLLDDADILDAISSTGDYPPDVYSIACSQNVPPELLIIKLNAMNGRGYTFNNMDAPDSRFLGRIQTYAEKVNELNNTDTCESCDSYYNL